MMASLRGHKMEKFFTTGDVAKFLNANSETIRRYCDSGELAFEKGPLTNHRRISHESLLRFLEKRGISKDILEKEFLSPATPL